MAFIQTDEGKFNPFYAELNPICHLLALLGAQPIHHISRIRVKGAQTLKLKPDIKIDK